jgi:hypothetical protein
MLDYLMPFKSKAQMRAAFAGTLGEAMRKNAKHWADETGDLSKLPEYASKKKKKRPRKKS